MTPLIDPAAIASALEQSYRRLEARQFNQALWGRRVDVWNAGPAARERIAARLGWLDAVDIIRPHVPRLRACAQSIQDERPTDIVLLGMGGSSLAPEVMRRVLGVAAGLPAFRVLDSVDPDAVRAAMARADSSLFIFASKSGTTVEPHVMAAEAERRLRAAGVADIGSRFIAITDEGTALHSRAVAGRFRDVFINPADIGGRYSALSFFGLVPAAMMGVDLDALLASAAAMMAACRADDPRQNPGLTLGAAMGAAALGGRDKLTLLLPERLESFGLWIEQLVAESTGKQGKGIVPIAAEDPATPPGDDRIVATIQDMREPSDLGAAFFQWMVATAAAGWLLDINPFDEPNVQQAKDATRALLDTYTPQRGLLMREPHAALSGVRLTLSSAAEQQLGGDPPETFLQLIQPRDYVALLAYLPPDDEAFARALRAFRNQVGAARRCATMLGYGPRYLHSTGQLHKGGPNTGVFIVLTAPAAEDLPIPGEAYSFGVLELAQAVGDFQSLDRMGRRALHVHLPGRDPDLLLRITNRLLQF